MPLTTTPKKNPHLAEPFRINEHNLTTFFAGSDDVIISSHMIGESPQQIVIVYCSGMVDSKSIYDIILPELTRTYESTHFVRASDIEKSITLQWTSIDIQNNPLGKELMSLRVFEGHMLICIPSIQKMWSMDISNIPTRSPDESTTEVSIRGSRDGFIERLSVNIALIRTRLRTAELACNIELIGSRSVTKVALMYIKDIANPELIDDVKNQLRKIDIERIMTANELEELLSPSKVTLFPVTHYTGRPDFAAECLLNGRFVIIVDGNPSVIIGPVNLFLLLKSPEDASFPFLPVNVGRMLRFIGLLITVFLPGFYIALTSFHMDQLPFPLVATISVGRMGLPMESGVEMFLIMLLMELFRGSRCEASQRHWSDADRCWRIDYWGFGHPCRHGFPAHDCRHCRNRSGRRNDCESGHDQFCSDSAFFLFCTGGIPWHLRVHSVHYPVPDLSDRSEIVRHSLSDAAQSA
ncbi:Spore germination protein XA [Paenibacillus sp. AD87]|nr:Spore germination protein XA [Paenibacillus sp. AD87]